MLFLRTLKQIQKEKSLAKIDFDDGNRCIGFVIYSDEETFDVYRLDTVYNNVIIEEDFDGAIMLESEEDAKSIDSIFVKSTYQTMMISDITHDFSHKFSAEKTAYFNIVKEELYKPKERKKKTVSKKNVVKNKREKVNNRKAKQKREDEEIGEKNQ